MNETKLYKLNSLFAQKNKLPVYFAANSLIETSKAQYLFGRGTLETQKMGCCCVCGRTLTHPVSVLLGIGPECGGHWWDWNVVGGYTEENLAKLRLVIFDMKIDQWIPKTCIKEILDTTDIVETPIDHPMFKRPAFLNATPKKIVSLAENQKTGERLMKIQFPFDKTDLDLVKSISGRRYHDEGAIKYWTAPLSKEALKLLTDRKFVLDEDLKALLNGSNVENKAALIQNIPGLKMELFPYQKEGVSFIENHLGRALVADEMGLGKAQPWYSNILTPDGWKMISKLRVGDLIFGPDGGTHFVTGIFPQGEKQIFAIKFSDNFQCECCEDHLWNVQSAKERWLKKGYKTRSLKYINDKKLFNGKNSKWFIPITNPIKFNQKDLPINPYVLGALIGDGSLNSKLKFTNSDLDIIEKIKNLLPDSVELKKDNNAQIEYLIVKKDDKKYKNPIKTILKDWQLNTTSEFKFIPEEYKYSSISQRIELLRGLMDTDGYISKKNKTIQYTTVSKRLCYDITFIIQSLGGICKISSKIPKYTYKEKEKNGKEAYTITINLPAQINPFYCNRKRSQFQPNKKYFPARAIKEITPIKKEDAYCISTSHPEGLYITDNCIVTHNTAQSLAYLQLHPELRPAIVVCPASLKLNWAKEANMWMTKPKIQILSGENPSVPLVGEIIIINYDVLPFWANALSKIKAKVLITDECHYYKNNAANRTKAVKKLGKSIPHVIALSGTPIINRPVEMFNALKFIDNMLFTNFWEYAQTYCNARHNGFGWDFSGSSNTEELHQKLTSSIMIRRKKADVLKDLPDKMYSFVPMELDNERDYRRAENDFIGYIKDTKGAAAASKASNAEILAQIETLKQLAVKGSLKQAIEWIENFIETDGKLVVFAVHKFVIDALMEAFPGIAVKIDGSISNENRQKSVEEFQNNDKIRLFFGNIQAAGVGITLTAASKVAILEFPWSPGALDQAIDRVHRIGQKDSVTAYYLVAPGTIVEKIAYMLDSKRKVLDAVLDGKVTEEDSLLSEIMNEYLNKLL